MKKHLEFTREKQKPYKEIPSVGSEVDDFIIDNIKTQYQVINTGILIIATFSVLLFLLKWMGFEYIQPYTNIYIALHLILAFHSFYALFYLDKPKLWKEVKYLKRLLVLSYLYVLVLSTWAIVTSCMDIATGHHPVTVYIVMIAVPFFCILRPWFLCTLTTIGSCSIIAAQILVGDGFDLSFTSATIVSCIATFIIIIRTYSVLHNNYILSKRLNEEARRDELTGLYNRRALEQTIETFNSLDIWYHIAMIDIDNFKTINDKFGHSVGDEALIALAKTLKSHFPDDEVYRYGGDEFIILTRFKNEDILRKLEEINAKLSLCIDGVNYHISGGYCKYDGKSNIAEVKANADKALYEAKKAGKRCFIEFSMNADNN